MNSSNKNESEFEEVYSKLCETIDFWCDYKSEDFDDVFLDDVGDKAHNLASWYNNTQSLMKLLYELEAAGKLTDKQKRTYHRKRKEFGWDKVKSEKDFIDSNLNTDSPYAQLVTLFEHDCMAYRRKKKVFQAIDDHYKEWQKQQARELCKDGGLSSLQLRQFAISDLAYTMARLREVEADGGLRTYIDENSGVSDLYKESEEVEAQALKDIQDIRVLTERLNKLLELIDNDPAMKRRKVAIENEVIYKAIEIGYTAGLNANTTQMLRRSNDGNSSGNKK